MADHDAQQSGPEPTPAFSRASTRTFYDDTDIYDSHSQREATELEELDYSHLHGDNDDRRSLSSGSVSTGELHVTPRRTRSRTSSVRQDTGPFRGIRKFWARNVALTVPQKSNRDHFALERTFLAYFRTSLAFSMQGVLIAQLFHIQRFMANPTPRFGFYIVGVPLSVLCHCTAILVVGMGAHRFWRQQSAIALGKVHAGGWELNCIGALTAGVLMTIFALAIAIIIAIDERRDV
ncbi:hypothetical protein M432DRAFT_66197 [Thermoascus aurantiacus ATCC 26904]